MIRRLALGLVLAVVSCGQPQDDDGERARDRSAGEALPVPDPTWLEDARFVRLLQPDLGDDDLSHLATYVLTVADEKRLLSALMLLTRAQDPRVSMAAFDTLSTGYHLAARAGVDTSPWIELGLHSDRPRVRRVVLRNISQFEEPNVRAWLNAATSDEAVDEMGPNHETVAAQARDGLARLDEAARRGLSLRIADELTMADCQAGETVRVPMSQGDGGLVVSLEVTTIEWKPAGLSTLQLPFVTGTAKLETSSGAAIAVVNLSACLIYGRTDLTTSNVSFSAWCRPIARDRVRLWFRFAVQPAPK